MNTRSELEKLKQENNSLKTQLSLQKQPFRKRPRPGNRETKSLRHLRLNQQLVNAIVSKLQGVPSVGTYAKRSGRVGQLSERVDDLLSRYTFSLSSKIDSTTGQPALNVQTNQAGSRVFRLVPREQVTKIIRSIYEHPGEGGFRGRDAIYSLIRRSYVGITRSDVERFLNKRPIRQQYKRKQKKVSTSILPADKRGVWQIDFIQMKQRNDRYRYVCVIVDMYSKYLWAFPLRERTQYKRPSNKYNQVMENIIGTDFICKLRNILDSEGGGPKIMQSDNEFRSEAYRRLMKEKGIEVRYSLPYSPQTNGGVERINGTLKDCLMKCMLNVNGRWIGKDGKSGCLPQCIYSYNNHKHRSTGKSPVEIHRPYLYHSLEKKMRDRLGLIEDEGDNFPGDGRSKPSISKPDPAVTRHLHINAKKRLDKHKQDALHPGDLVRVRIIPNKPLTNKKNKIQELGGSPNWSEEVYRVEKNLGRNRYTIVESEEGGTQVTTNRDYFKEGKKVSTKRPQKFMRHQLLKVELPSPDEEPYDPLLRQRVMEDMQKPIGSAGCARHKSSISKDDLVAKQNQNKLGATRAYHTRSKKRNARYATRGSGNQRLLKGYDDPADFAAIQAMQDEGREAKRRHKPREVLSERDIERVRWELDKLGLQGGNDMQANVRRLLLARKLNQLSNPQLRARLSSFAVRYRTGQPPTTVPLSIHGSRPQLLSRLVRATEASNMTVAAMRSVVRHAAQSWRGADVFRAYVRQGEAAGISDKEVDRIGQSSLPDYAEMQGQAARTFIANKTWDGTLSLDSDAADRHRRFDRYLDTMSKDGIWGGEPEVKAAAERYGVRIHVHSKIFFALNKDRSSNTYNPLDDNASPQQAPIHLLNLTNTHYRLLEPCDSGSAAQARTQPYDRSARGLAFSAYLRNKRNLCEVEMGMDGNCLFLCLARALRGNGQHAQIRQDIVAHMQQHRARFLPFTI